MSARVELSHLTLDNIMDAIAVMNASSAGRTFAFDLDLFKFLSLSRFWRLTYPYSHVAYVEGQPAGVLLNSVDPAAREAYTFYWGVAERFRRTRVAWELLVHAYLGRLRREGYVRTSGDTSADSPMSSFHKLGYRPACELVELAADGLDGDAGLGARQVRSLRIGDLLTTLPTGETRPWTATPYFLEGAESMLETLGVWRGERLMAWLAATRFTGFTVMMLLGHAPGASADLAALIRALPARGFPAPFTASHIRPASPECAVLESLGFRTRQRWLHISLDLTASPAR
jgi:hypothetical protein